MKKMKSASSKRFKVLDFFAGSGLVTEGLKPNFEVVWANDNCPKKKEVYTNNFGNDHFVFGSIEDIEGKDVPEADLSWASFPCQDLSLAGKMNGMENGTRSALFWEWLRVIDEMGNNKRPDVLCIENVVGFLVAKNCEQFRLAYKALKYRGYRAGAIVIDAKHFTPQSRPRSFIIAVKEHTNIDSLTSTYPLKEFHNSSVLRAFKAVDDDNWVWWNLPNLPERKLTFSDICDREASVNREEKNKKLLGLLSPRCKKKLEKAIKENRFIAGTGYKRIRVCSDGKRRQRLEIRFDGIAGCLRTPTGGSSRQLAILVEDQEVNTRLITISEAAILMGLEDSYWLPQKYNDAYFALGDAVAVPVTRFLSKHLLSKLCERTKESRLKGTKYVFK